MSFYNTNNISTTTVSTNFVQLSNATNFCALFSIQHLEAISITNVVASILTILTNVLYCYRIYKKPRQHKYSIILTVNCHITLILIGLFSLFIFFPFDHPKGVIGSMDVFNAIWSFSFAALLTTITAVFVERYFAINRREYYKKHSTPVKMGFIVLFIWLYLLIWVVVMVYFFKHVENIKVNEWNIQHVLYIIFISIHVCALNFSTPLLYLIRRHVKGLRERSPINDEMEIRDKQFIAGITINIFASGTWILWILILPFTIDCTSKDSVVIYYTLPLACFMYTIGLKNPILNVCIYFKHLKNRFCKCRCLPDGSRPDDGEYQINQQDYEEI